MPAADTLGRLIEAATAVEPQPRLRPTRDGEDHYQLVGVPCGFPVATFGTIDDAAFDLAARQHWSALLACVRAGKRLDDALRKAADRAWCSQIPPADGIILVQEDWRQVVLAHRALVAALGALEATNGG